MKNHPGQGLEALLEAAIATHQQGRLVDAGERYRQVLKQDPANVDALQLLGILEFQQQNFPVAVEFLQRAVRLAPQEPGLFSNLGLAQQQLGQLKDALASYQRALDLHPEFVEAMNNCGNVLRDMKRLPESEVCYRKALGLRPDFVEAMHNLGICLLAQHRADEAWQILSQCLILAPGHAGALQQSGVALMLMGRATEALDCFTRVLSMQSGDAEAHYWQGNALLALKQPEAAARAYQRAAALRRDIPEVYYNLGNALGDLAQHEEALTAYEQALAVRPGYIEAMYNRAGLLQDMRRYADAESAYAQLQIYSPNHRYSLGSQFGCRQFIGRWDAFTEQRAAIIHSVEVGAPSIMPLPFLAVSDNAALQQRCAQAYASTRYPPLGETPDRRRKPAGERLRIAYVSADFREHAVSYLLAGVFETHDRSRVETIGIGLKASDGSAMAERVSRAFNHYYDVSRMDDLAVTRLMRELGVDVAVDLTGFTQDNRTEIFARRAAPIQINYLGFPGSMGAPYMDYLIADEFVIPPELRSCYSEKIVSLPACFQANDDQRIISGSPQTREAWGLPENAFVFCSFNNTYKISPEVFTIWMRLLAQVPDSVLWLSVGDAIAQQNFRAEAQARGVAPERLVFCAHGPYAEHLARLRLADLFLDTLPFNAGTTASDALWAGLPLLTCAGDAFAGRMAGSLLNAIGLPELVTRNFGEYEAKALELATHSERLAAHRAALQRNRLTSPLFDTRQFSRNLEAAYFAIWERYQQGKAAAHVTLTSDNQQHWIEH